MYDVAQGEDAEPQVFRRNGSEDAHTGTIKSVVWDEPRRTVVSMGDDRTIRYAGFYLLVAC
jgi:hypothetical protein